jgi:AraC-like DNA-binding protein
VIDAGDFGLSLLGHGARLGHGTASKAIAVERLRVGAQSGVVGANEPLVIWAYFPLVALGRNPFAGVLPEFIHVSRRANPLVENAQPLVEFIVQEYKTRVAGWEATVESVVKTLLSQALRAYVTSQSGILRHASWLSAAMDPTIGPVLTRIHDQPEMPWTVNSLARECNMAKSAFSERFREVVGESPLQYVTGYRMQKACELLCESELAVKEIATRVGYECASSFSNAFKRLIGKSPADFRKQPSCEPNEPNH